MDKADAEIIKQKIEECLKLTSIEDENFIHLSLKMTLAHTIAYIERENGRKEGNSP
tara:strand:- start:397 stop:564 length:168 start_codon:yes stop_codon:yes gene_type:complete